MKPKYYLSFFHIYLYNFLSYKSNMWVAIDYQAKFETRC